jgi:hypothetical protein
MLHPPNNRRERTLIYGRFDSGKSHAWMSIAHWIRDTNSTARIHVGDTDNSWEAMRPADGSLDNIVLVTDLDINDYRVWTQWAKKLRSEVSRDDWVVVDMIDDTYQAAQNYYWDQMAPDDLLADIYLRNQQNIEGMSGGESMAGPHGGNWGVIYKYYYSFITPVVNMKCNVLCCARAREIRKEDVQALKDEYKVGWRPAGPGALDKDLSHLFLTVLYAGKSVEKGWVYTTIREKGPVGEKREYFKGGKVDDYVTTYLMGVAGWRP